MFKEKFKTNPKMYLHLSRSNYISQISQLRMSQNEDDTVNDPLNLKSAEIEESTYTNISPMLLENAFKSKNRIKNESLCIRFCRKKFI